MLQLFTNWENVIKVLNSFQWHSPLPLMITHYDTIKIKTELISF